MPPAPATIDDTGLSYEQLKQLIVKALYAGELSGLALADKLCLPYMLLESLVEHLRIEKLLEVRGAHGSGTAGYRYALTELGRERGGVYFEGNGYVGPAPVPLNQYTAAMHELKAQRGFLDRERIAHGFTHLIVSPETLDQLGPAVNSGKSVFLYGPPGNGKTVVAEGIGRALGGDIYVPWALDIDGQIITIFDPVNHVALDDELASGSIIKPVARDRRWVRIKRPVVTVGGELTLEMLDLSFNPIAKFYEAPLQMKANGGVFVVDDFGRQRIRPRDLLNRWIVPLESRDRLPDAAHGQEVRDAVRRPDRVRDEPQPRVAGGRGVPPPHPLQDLREEPDHGRVRQDLRAELQAQGHRLRSRHHRVPALAGITSRAVSRCAAATRATSSSRSSTSAGIRTSRS